MKKIGTFLTVICMCLLFMGTGVHLQAATGKTSVAVSAGTVKAGETVKITAMAEGPSGEKTAATMTISYDTSVFSFVDCSTNYSGGNGNITATAERYTITLKALGEGSSKIAIAASGGVLSASSEKLESMEGSSTTVKVSGTASTNVSDETKKEEKKDETVSEDSKLSADNSLQSLSISSGSLSPAFTGKTVQYTATVPNDVTRIDVNPVVANEKATVESVTGNENLSVGNNAVKIVVKAENGALATYTINVTRQETGASAEKKDEPAVITEEPLGTDDSAKDNAESAEPVTATGETVTIGEVSYGISESFSSEMIPKGCTETTINYHGTDYKGIQFENGNLSMIYLVPSATSDGAGAGFYIYDASGDGFYPFAQLKNGDNFIIWLPNPADYVASEGEQQADITLKDGNTIKVNQPAGEEMADFSFFYAVNQDGTMNWYQYDALEQTYQRRQAGNSNVVAENQETDSNIAYLQEEYNTLENTLKKEKSFSRTLIGVLIFIIAVLMIIIINLILRRREDSDNYDFGEDEYEEEFEELEETPIKKQTETVKETSDIVSEPVKKKKEKRAKKPKFFSDDFDDIEEEEEIIEEKKIEKKPDVNYEEKKETEHITKSKDGIEVIDFNDL